MGDKGGMYGWMMCGWNGYNQTGERDNIKGERLKGEERERIVEKGRGEGEYSREREREGEDSRERERRGRG
jgi:hypothetical protein